MSAGRYRDECTTRRVRRSPLDGHLTGITLPLGDSIAFPGGQVWANFVAEELCQILFADYAAVDSSPADADAAYD